jgi:hypothetical protein
MITTELDDIRNAVTDDKLLMLAISDAIESMMQRAVVGRSIPNAIVALDQLRQQLERARP